MLDAMHSLKSIDVTRRDLTIADLMWKTIKVKPDLPERYVRAEAQARQEAEEADRERLRQEQERARREEHFRRIEAGESSEDEEYWEHKEGGGYPEEFTLNSGRLPSFRTRSSGGSSYRSIDITTLNICDVKPYAETRQHMDVLLASEVRDAVHSQGACVA